MRVDWKSWGALFTRERWAAMAWSHRIFYAFFLVVAAIIAFQVLKWVFS